MLHPPLTDQRTYQGYDQPNVMVTVDEHQPEGNLDGRAHGTFHGTTRMAGRDEDGHWWRLVTWTGANLATTTSWFPDTHVRRPGVEDFEGIVPDRYLEQLRAELDEG